MPIVIVGIIGTVVAGYVAGVDPVVDFVKGIADALAAVADAVISLLPNAADLNLDAGSGWITGYAWANTFMPIGEVLGMIAIWITVQTAIFLYRLADRTWHTIPKPMSGT